MEKRLITASILVVSFIILILFAAFNAGYIFSERVTGYSSGDASAAGQNISSENASVQDDLKNNIVDSYLGDVDNPDFREISAIANGFGEFVLYDEDEMRIYSAGDKRNDISLSVERVRLMDRIYLKDLYSGYEYEISPLNGYKFLLVSLTAAPVAEYLEEHNSPGTSSYLVIDPSGSYSPSLVLIEDIGAVIENEISLDELVNSRFVIRGLGELYVGKAIFSSLNAVSGSGPLTGWIIYDVPEDFSVSSDTYLMAEIGGEKVYWRLHDVQVYIQVKKNYDSGRITVSYSGGPESYLIRSIDAEMIKADGSVENIFIDADEGEQYLPETEFFLSGTPGGQDQLLIKVIRSDGVDYVKYDKLI